MSISRKDRMCVDRVLPLTLAQEARDIAIRENEKNAAPPDASGNFIGLVRAKMWKPGRTLRVRFLDGSATLQERVKQVALGWTQYENLRFDFGNDANSEIRISFSFDPNSSWSAIGTDCLVEKYFPKYQPTMNFGWLDDATDDTEVSRVVLHEFGHAIGCIHEHQSPNGGIEWNVPAVLKYFSGPPNYWDEQTIRFNILDKYKARDITGTPFDEDSIMLYDFPASLIIGGKGTHSNTRLSAQDIGFIRTAYPQSSSAT
jgi:hypothetical protein